MRAALNTYGIPIMDLLVSHGANVNALWHGHFPIIFAPSVSMDPAALEWLLDRGSIRTAAIHGYRRGRPYPGTALDYLIRLTAPVEQLSACIDIFSRPVAGPGTVRRLCSHCSTAGSIISATH